MILWRECYANDFDDDYLLCNFVKIKFFFDRNTRNSLNSSNKKEKRDISLLFSYIVMYHLYILNLKKKKRKISIKICTHNNNFIQKCSPTINNIFDKSISINIVNIIDCISKRINRIQNIIVNIFFNNIIIDIIDRIGFLNARFNFPGNEYNRSIHV